jgi:hypothetical protein
MTLDSGELSPQKSCREKSSSFQARDQKTPPDDFVDFATPLIGVAIISRACGVHEIVRTPSCDPLARRTNIPSARAPKRPAAPSRAFAAPHAPCTLSLVALLLLSILTPDIGCDFTHRAAPRSPQSNVQAAGCPRRRSRRLGNPARQRAGRPRRPSPGAPPRRTAFSSTATAPPQSARAR